MLQVFTTVNKKRIKAAVPRFGRARFPSAHGCKHLTAPPPKATTALSLSVSRLYILPRLVRQLAVTDLRMQNPALVAPGQQPVPMNGEIFVLSRSGIGFSAKSGRHKFEGKGDLYLSTLRLVFVSKGHGDLQGFDLPLATQVNESFNQPIFGANNLSGESPPLEGTGLQDIIKWVLYFNHGGVGTFLPLFFRLLSEMRNRMAQSEPTNAFTSVEAQQIIQAAYVDPNDPSKLYVSQPTRSENTLASLD